MNAKMYDLLKVIAQYILPALGTLYFALSGIWGFPNGEQVVGSITAIDVFLGVIIGVSSSQFNKTKDGTLMIDTSNLQKDTYRLQLDTPLDALAGKSTIQLIVDNAANLNNTTPQ